MSSHVTISPVRDIAPVEEGSVWEWLTDIQCRSGHTIRKGDRARVIKKTGLVPYGEIMDRGYNLLVETSNGITVWATFEQCVSRELLRKVRDHVDAGTRHRTTPGDADSSADVRLEQGGICPPGDSGP